MADLVQYLEDTPARPQAKFSSGNVLTDLDGPAGGTCTVTLTRPDGTAGPAAGTVTHVATGIYEITVDAPADPYWYDVEWAGTIGARTVKAHTRVEWIGGFLFNVADLRAMKVAGGTPFSSSATYPDTLIHDTRTEVLEEFTEILGFSPVPRFVREVKSVGYGDTVNLKELTVSKVLSVTVAGVAQTASNFYVTEGNDLVPVSSYLAAPWTHHGLGNVAVEYVAGKDRVPGRGRHAAMLMAGAALNPAPFSSASTISMPTGESYTYEPAETGRWGFQRHTGVRELDRWLNRWAQPGLAVA